MKILFNGLMFLQFAILGQALASGSGDISCNDNEYRTCAYSGGACHGFACEPIVWSCNCNLDITGDHPRGCLDHYTEDSCTQDEACAWTGHEDDFGVHPGCADSRQ